MKVKIKTTRTRFNAFFIFLEARIVFYNMDYRHDHYTDNVCIEVSNELRRKLYRKIFSNTKALSITFTHMEVLALKQISKDITPDDLTRLFLQDLFDQANRQMNTTRNIILSSVIN